MSKKKLEVKKSRTGLGLYTNQDISRGDFVVRYVGELITRKEADRRGGRYLFTVKRGFVIDGKSRDNLARYINHSCRPNCFVEIEEDKNKIKVIAKKKILAGEELTYNYGKEYWEEFIGPKKCTCPKCAERKSKKVQNERKPSKQ